MDKRNSPATKSGSKKHAAKPSAKLKLQRIETISKDPQAFAITVEGDNMAPELKNGDRLVLEPSRKANSGDAVLVKLNDGRTFVGWLVTRGRMVRLEFENRIFGPVEFRFNEIQFIYPAFEIQRRIAQRSKSCSRTLPATRDLDALLKELGTTAMPEFYRGAIYVIARIQGMTEADFTINALLTHLPKIMAAHEAKVATGKATNAGVGQN